MSQCFSIACKDCKVSLWIAQGSYSDKTKGSIYSTDKHLKAHYLFLREHRGHNLLFDDHAQSIMSDENYEKIEVDED